MIDTHNLKNRHLCICKWLFSFFFLLLIGCSLGDTDKHTQALSQWMEQNGKIKVISTIAMINDLVKQVGGDHVDAITLIKGDLNPHSYQLVKGDDEKLAFADLIFYNGLGLEHGPSLQNYLQKNKKAIPVGNRLMQENPNQLLYFNGQIDPHIWMDMALWAKIVPYIVEALSEKDPIHADFYFSNGKELTKNLLEFHLKIKNKIQEIPSEKRYLITSHDAFNYFTRVYLSAENEEKGGWEKRFAAPESLAPESQISANDIQAVLDHLQQYNIHVIFSESNVNKDSIQKIVRAAQEKGFFVKLSKVPLFADAMGKPGSDGDTYIKMIEHNAQTISNNLKSE